MHNSSSTTTGIDRDYLLDLRGHVAHLEGVRSPDYFGLHADGLQGFGIVHRTSLFIKLSANLPAQMLWNWNTIDTCFLSSSWHVKSSSMFAGSCIGVVLLTLLLEFLRCAVKEFDRYLIRKHSAAPVASSARSNPGDTKGKEVPTISARADKGKEIATKSGTAVEEKEVAPTSASADMPILGREIATTSGTAVVYTSGTADEDKKAVRVSSTIDQHVTTSATGHEKKGGVTTSATASLPAYSRGSWSTTSAIAGKDKEVATRSGTADEDKEAVRVSSTIDQRITSATGYAKKEGVTTSATAHMPANSRSGGPMTSATADKDKEVFTTSAPAHMPTNLRKGFRPNLLEQVIRALLHTLQFALAYFVMLLAMYYNGYIIISIFIGAYLGAFLFHWEILNEGATEQATVHCG
ncbi:Uu.00g098260.m01.CDS01 [Anthostomella pinea]|uniref:Copper transport protein n=1 Tax=Anthostomella pinea TaxID=933095 RepID=A0AAI8VD39_9PEZI|nr:Uu.00g098260.m01.CDS01 [Anthostomella pinea]